MSNCFTCIKNIGEFIKNHCSPLVVKETAFGHPILGTINYPKEYNYF